MITRPFFLFKVAHRSPPLLSTVKQESIEDTENIDGIKKNAGNVSSSKYNAVASFVPKNENLPQQSGGMCNE